MRTGLSARIIGIFLLTSLCFFPALAYFSISATREHLEQAFVEKATTVARLIACFAAQGYERVKPPLLEFEDTLLSGPGSDVAQPMAIPVVGGMILELISLFIVPMVYCWVKELKWRWGLSDPAFERPDPAA